MASASAAWASRRARRCCATRGRATYVSWPTSWNDWRCSTPRARSPLLRWACRRRMRPSPRHRWRRGARPSTTRFATGSSRGCGGRIEGLSPSGLLASFGLGLAEDAPTRSGHAALAMQKTLERSRKMGGVAPRFKAAIHVTEALVAHGAERQEIDVDARHQAVAVLDGLLALSAPEAIVVSEPAGPFLERRFDLWEVDQPRPHFVLGGHVRTRLGLGGRGVRFVDR